jgi:MFS family permease
MAIAKPSTLLTGRRFFIALFLLSAIAINYIDRVNLSVAAPVIAKQFGWNPAQMGWLFSAYLWTYAFFLIPCGWLADRYGARSISALAIFIWSASGVLTGAATNFTNIIASRLGLGAGEAATIPVSNKIIRQWFPPQERGFATTIFHSGIFITVAFSSPMIAWLVIRTGWRGSFVISGSLGFVWLLCWLRWFQPPENCRWLAPEERQFILENRDRESVSAKEEVKRKTDIAHAVGSLLSQQSMWGLALSLGCANYMNTLFITWLPSYLMQARGMNLMKAGIYTGVPYLVGAILELCFGRLSDLLLPPQRVRRGARRYHVITFMLLSSVILLINFARTEAAVLTILSLALACNTIVIAFLYALTNDLIEDSGLAGTAFGILLLGGNLIGLAAPIITGYLVKTSGSFNTAFDVSGALPLIGAMIAFSFTRRPINRPAAAQVGEPRVATP